MSELSTHQKKIYPIDDHVGCSIAGLTSDGRLLRYIMWCITWNSDLLYSLTIQPVYEDRVFKLTIPFWLGDAFVAIGHCCWQQYPKQFMLQLMILSCPSLTNSEMQYSTQVYGRRPYGVGILIAGCDVSVVFKLIICYTPVYYCRIKEHTSIRLVLLPTIMTVRQWPLEQDLRYWKTNISITLWFCVLFDYLYIAVGLLNVHNFSKIYYKEIV